MNNHNAILEYFQSGFKLEWLPFDDHLVQVYFPVMKGTKYARESCEIYPKYLPELIELSKEKWYTEKLKMLSTLTSKDFKEHSLFLLKEHLSLFKDYSELAKQLYERL